MLTINATFFSPLETSIYLLRIGPFPTINKWFSIHTREWENRDILGWTNYREIFTYVVIITLTICHITKSTHPLDGLHFIHLPFPSTTTCLRLTLRWGGFSPLFPAVTSTVGFCPSGLFILWCYQTSINIT